MKILVIQQKMIGDVLTSTIICENLKNLYPECEIHYMAHSHTLAVVENNPFIDKILNFKPEYREKKQQFFLLLKRIKKQQYNIVIDVYGKWETNIISYFSQSKMRIGYYKWYTKFFYTHPIKRFRESRYGLGLALENRLQLLTPISTDSNMDSFISKPKIYLGKYEIAKAKKFLVKHSIDKNNPLYMIGILGSHALKTYPLEYMAQILDYIVVSSGATLLFNFIPKQASDAQRLYEMCSEATKKHIKIDAFAPSLRDFLGVLSLCDALIGNEGGTVNMAKALDIPSFSIFSPWIDKKEWGLFESTKHMSVHLRDTSPALFTDKTSKNLKKEAIRLYKDFTPEKIIPLLKEFI